MSGSIFCVIKSAPAFGYGGGGRRNKGGASSVVLFAPQGRDQYLIEGFIVALWSLGCGVVGYIMIAVTKMRRFPILRHILVMLCMAIWMVLLLQIFESYCSKTGWYSLKDTLPSELASWFTASVKKNTALPKRLYRISEIWLLDTKYGSKEWVSGFMKKFQLLVVDYIVRTLSTAAAGSSSGAK